MDLRGPATAEYYFPLREEGVDIALCLQGSPSLYSKGVKVEVADVLRPSLEGSTAHFCWILFIKANHRPIQVLNKLHLFMGEVAKISSHLCMYHSLLAYPLKSSATEEDV